MPPTIDVSQAVHEELHRLAGPLFSPSDVIERLLASNGGGATATNAPIIAPPGPPERIAGRAPRERGVVVAIAGQRISAVSVRDLYEQVLRYLVDQGVVKKIDKSLPHRTSNQRYLIAREPLHPNANPFVVPVEYKGYYMEAHKNYENAIAGLRQIAKIANIRLEYVA